MSAAPDPEEWLGALRGILLTSAMTKKYLTLNAARLAAGQRKSTARVFQRQR